MISDFTNLRYLDAVVKESLRLYPPVPFISRANTTPLKLSSGMTLPIGTVIHFHIYDLHRDPDVFEEPERFDPERFMKNQQYNPFSYIPFSAGIRNCIGDKKENEKKFFNDALKSPFIVHCFKIKYFFFAYIFYRTKICTTRNKNNFSKYSKKFSFK